MAVTAADAYDVGALLAKIRAAQLRDRAAVRTLQADAELDLHIQAPTGRGGDLGFSFGYFEKAGEWPEMLQKEVRLNGVKAKLQGEVQLPLIESRQSMSLPVALGLTERYRYRDGGPAGPGRRRLRFEPVDADPLLFSGDLVADEATGQVLEERRERSSLPGTVKSEREILTYGEVAPGVLRPVSVADLRALDQRRRRGAGAAPLPLQRFPPQRARLRDGPGRGPHLQDHHAQGDAGRDALLHPAGGRHPAHRGEAQEQRAGPGGRDPRGSRSAPRRWCPWAACSTSTTTPSARASS